ncbi:MAG TPA: glycosyltransferase family 9 protein [bacterium]|nr:glycosyltransferase family 9 protein [bacterium]HQP97417.1 glycosyltransferase family 9 protein [bacterium]
MNEQIIHTDCRWYVGDRPCRPHKREGVVCADCAYEMKISQRILIVKLGAAGDVLRTTSLLEPLRRTEPNAHITWLTAPSAVPLLENIEQIDRVLPLTPGTLAILAVETFDLVCGLDLDAESTAVSELVQAKEKRGFGRTSQGAVKPFDPSGIPYLQMSLWDDLKRANTKTYQDLMLEILHLDGPIGKIQVPISPQCTENVNRRAREQWNVDPSKPAIGLNIGAGGRWKKKAWTLEGFQAIAERVHSELGATVLLLCGPEDLDRAEYLLKHVPTPLIDTGGDNSLAEFAAVMNLCDVVVTGDTLGLHFALGLGKRVIVPVGPTSSAELELYGQGTILQGAVDCLGCYLPDCDRNPDCMQSLSADVVWNAVREQFALVGR